MRGSDKKSQYFILGLNNCIENKVDILLINNWRASLVPAAAVIPAPIAYIKVVAVKKLVVGFRSGPVGPPQGVLLTGLLFFAKTAYALC